MSAIVETTRKVLDVLRPMTDEEAVRVLDAVSLVYEVDDATCAKPAVRRMPKAVHQPRPAPVDRHPVTDCDDVPQPIAVSEKTRKRANPKAIEACTAGIVQVVNRHPEGIVPREVARELGTIVQSSEFKYAARALTTEGRIRVEGKTNNRRYFPAER